MPKDSRQSPPPGWYLDTSGERMQWWDGEKWTDNFRDPPAEKDQDRDENFVTAGLIFAAVLPVIGIAIGLILMNRGDRRAIHVLVASVIFAVVWAVVFTVWFDAIFQSEVERELEELERDFGVP